MRTPSIRPLPWAMGVALAWSAATAGTALAESPTPAADNSGLMAFPNVRVVNAPAAASTKTPAANDNGVRAYIDPATRQLRPQTIEEAQQVAAESKTKLLAAPKGGALRQSAAAQSTSDSGGELIYGPGITVGVLVGEEAMTYQVAHKRAAAVEVSEVTGKQAADHDVSKKHDSVRSEVGHEK